MNQLLSQDEVDALLNGLDTGDIESAVEPDEEQTSVEAFDWASRESDIKSSMPLVGIVNNRFSQKLKGSLSNSIRKMIEVSDNPIEMIKFKQFQRSLPIPTSLHLFRIEPLRGTGILVVESHLVFNLVEAFFGGRGTGSTKIEGRDFTPIENKIIEKVVHIALMNLMESWEDVHPIKTSFIRSESNPLVVNIVPPEEYLLSTKFDVELNKPMGSITISIPYSSYQPIRHKLAGTYQQEEETQVDQLWQNTLQERLKETKLEMCVNLGRTKLSIRDLLNLKTGDIMILDKDFTDPLVAKVEGIPKYEGYVGRLKDRKVFRVEQNL